MTNRLKSEYEIWIIEDDTGIQFVYRDILGLRYKLEVFSSMREFRERSTQASRLPDLIIADLSLPDGNFFEVLSKKPAHLSGCSFLVVSSMDDLDLLRACFDEGVLDYLIKPFQKNELIVKVERIVSSAKPLHSVLKKGEIVIEPEAFQIRRGPEHCVRLTAKEIQIFSLLHQSNGKAVSKSKLKSVVWGDTSVCDKALDVHLFNIRRKITKIGVEIKYVAPEGYILLMAN